MVSTDKNQGILRFGIDETESMTRMFFLNKAWFATIWFGLTEKKMHVWSYLYFLFFLTRLKLFGCIIVSSIHYFLYVF